MLDEVRSPETPPSAEEKTWVDVNPVVLVVQAFALAAIAIAIGVSVSHLLVSEGAFPRTTMVAAP